MEHFFYRERIIIPKFVIPKGQYPERSFIPTVCYSEGSLFRNLEYQNTAFQNSDLSE